jgi:hypothetical protein
MLLMEIYTANDVFTTGKTVDLPITAEYIMCDKE